MKMFRLKSRLWINLEQIVSIEDIPNQPGDMTVTLSHGYFRHVEQPDAVRLFKALELPWRMPK